MKKKRTKIKKISKRFKFALISAAIVIGILLLFLALDFDGDGLSNLSELQHGTSMFNSDTDGDGLSDGVEVNGFSITVNHLIQNVRSDPLSRDTDRDGLSDLEEFNHLTNPKQADTDGDGINDSNDPHPQIHEREFKPSSTVNAITPYWQKLSSITISAQASGVESEIESVTLHYRYSSNGTTWGNWVPFETDTASPWSWTFDFPSGDGYYQFYSFARDKAGNEEDIPTTRDAECGRDSIAPTSSVNPITPYWDNIPSRTITASASDSLSGVESVTLYYRYSNDNYNWGTWRAYGSDTSLPWSWSFIMPSGDGYYEFYSIAQDHAGNTRVAPVTADSRCGLDKTAPTSSVDVIRPYWRNVSPVTTSVQASDVLSGVKSVELQYRYSNDNRIWEQWISYGTYTSSPWSWSFAPPSGDGYYEFRSFAQDHAGNTKVGSAAESRCGLDRVAPMSSINSILPYWQVSLPSTITATATDDRSGVRGVTLWYRHSFNNATWGSLSEFGFSGEPSAWGFSAPLGDGYYEFYGVAEDEAGNTEIVPISADAGCAIVDVERSFPYLWFCGNVDDHDPEHYFPCSFYFDGDGNLNNNKEHYPEQNYPPNYPGYAYIKFVVDDPEYPNLVGIDYWFYYTYNNFGLPEWLGIPIKEHEHDWEGVLVVFEKDDLREPAWVTYRYHKWTKIKYWSETPKVGTHPIVYVASGSHASYWKTGWNLEDIPGEEAYADIPWYPLDFAGHIMWFNDDYEGRKVIYGTDQPEPLGGYWPPGGFGEANPPPWGRDTKWT